MQSEDVTFDINRFISMCMNMKRETDIKTCASSKCTVQNKFLYICLYILCLQHRTCPKCG